jgi:hypothetical protein
MKEAAGRGEESGRMMSCLFSVLGPFWLFVSICCGVICLSGALVFILNQSGCLRLAVIRELVVMELYQLKRIGYVWALVSL